MATGGHDDGAASGGGGAAVCAEQSGREIAPDPPLIVSLQPDEGLRARLEHECRRAQLLRVEGVARVLGWRERDAVLELERPGGTPLAELLADERPVLDRVLELAIALVSALARRRKGTERRSFATWCEVLTSPRRLSSKELTDTNERGKSTGNLL